MSAVISAHSLASRPLPLAVGGPDRVLVFGAGEPVALGTFMARAQALARTLPQARHVVHPAEDRYRFLLGFCAAALRGQVALLPPSGAPGTVAEILRAHGRDGAYRLEDRVLDAEALAPASTTATLLDPAALAAIGYTSGSTGRPQAHAKTWGAFAAGTAQNLAALRDLWAGAQPWIVATVPPQHMYGMELSVLLPLLGGAAVHAGRPLLPSDVAAALEQAQAPRLLVTTPVHLRALLASGVDLPPLCGIVSATAPLSQALAAEAEDRFGSEVREVFGSTETCVIACRRTARDIPWTPLPGVQVSSRRDGTRVHAPHLPAPVVLADLMELQADGRFNLCGRQADLLEIAGKRASLGDLTLRLLAVPGVEDGVVLQLPPGTEGGVGRLAALVVAPALSTEAIIAALRGSIDPVFLPRRLRLVERLPRNETGKLRREALLALLRRPASPRSSAVPEAGGPAS